MGRDKFPTSIKWLNQLAGITENVKIRSQVELQDHLPDLKLIGTSMSALYQASTCERKCFGGPHILESLVGRAFNLGQASYILLNRGLYDEALNLVRSLGEISNIIHLSVVDKNALNEWLHSDKSTRIKKFSPFEVRKRLEECGETVVLADKDWYSRFCEEFTHVNPQTSPNSHNEINRPCIGPVFQKSGMQQCISELSRVLFFIALPVCGYFELTDVWDELAEMANTEEN